MQVGDLVKLDSNEDYEGFGIIIATHNASAWENKHNQMFTVEWLDGMGTGLYWTMNWRYYASRRFSQGKTELEKRPEHRDNNKDNHLGRR